MVNPEPPRRVPNARRTFWVADAAGERWEIEARLRVQTDHVAMWIEEGIWHDVRRLEEAAAFFETNTYSTTRAAFGSEWTPGVDNDPHIHILHAAGLGEGLLGYTSSADEFPREVHAFSNQAEMITINLDAVEIASSTYQALLAQQFQRLIQWNQDRNEERWLKEGLADLAAWLNGPEKSSGNLEQAYLAQTDTSLTRWEDEEVQAAQRGAAHLFAVYFYERFGEAGIRALTAERLNGAAGFDAALTALGANLSFEELFADWLAANYLDNLQSDDASTDNPHHSYATLDLEQPAPAASYDTYPVTLTASVQQFGADYILPRGDADLQISFSGATETPLLDVDAHSGAAFWWSNRADNSLTTLTRSFDLSGVERATLSYWTWYDIERGYDYATLELSTDGQTWRPLRTPSSTDSDPVGSNPGWGYTGQSGRPAGWLEEQVDLTPYAGNTVSVRFAYLTDEAITGVGFLVDDIAIPEIGYTYDVEAGTGGWEAAGFVRSANAVPQRYLALLIGIDQEGQATVERLPLEEDQTGEWSVPLSSAGWREATLVLSGLAPLTAQAAPYELMVNGE